MKTRLSTSAILCGLLIHAAGCETAREDIGMIGEAFTTPSPAEAARMMTDLNDPDRRRRGLLLISNSPFGNAEAQVSWYRDRVGEERDPLVLATAIRALARHGVASDAQIIAPHLEHETEQVRWEAAKGLQRLHDPEVIPALLTTLRDEQQPTDVRVATATALGQYQEDRVFQGLIAALDHRELAVNDAAAQSLNTLTGADHGLNSRAWLAWYESVGSPDAVFANAQPYEFPTYSREIGWAERLAFWAPTTFEQPAPPAGLRPPDERTTYADDTDLTDG